MKLNIILYKFTLLANAPDEIYKLLKDYNQDKYTIHFIINNEKQLFSLLNNDDKFIIHFHNKILRSAMLNKKNIYKIIHYHSEPARVDLKNIASYKKLVLNQYHCTLPQYKNCKIVRNFFKYNEDIVFNDKIKIGFYPSTCKRQNKYFDKGYRETKKIFDKLSVKFPDVIFQIKSKMNYNNCIKTKSDCHIIIDECKTGSFHKSTIEGLMLGCNVVVNINAKIQNIHKKLYSQTLPVTNSPLSNLEKTLIDLIDKGKEQLEADAISKKKQFESYWNTDIVAKEYFDIYDSLVDNVK